MKFNPPQKANRATEQWSERYSRVDWHWVSSSVLCFAVQHVK